VGPRNTRKLDKLSAEIGPIDYPDSYDYGEAGALPRFIDRNIRGVRDPAAPEDPDKVEWYCDECSFRPWIDFGDAETASVTFAKRGGGSTRVEAFRQGGRWRTLRALGEGQAAVVGPGCVQDRFGNYNRDGSRSLGDPAAGLDPRCRVEGLVAGAVCPLASGAVRGRRLGRARLGFRRARHRRLMAGLTRPRRFVDRFCHADGGTTRIGYPSPRLRRLLGARGRIKGRAVLILTTSRHYALRGVRNGSSLRELRRRFHRLRRFKVGANTWFLARGGKARRLFKTRHGRVGEIGVASARLMRGRRQTRIFLRGFS
jgi:hypothetical protein